MSNLGYCLAQPLASTEWLSVWLLGVSSGVVACVWAPVRIPTLQYQPTIQCSQIQCRDTGYHAVLETFLDTQQDFKKKSWFPPYILSCFLGLTLSPGVQHGRHQTTDITNLKLETLKVNVFLSHQNAIDRITTINTWEPYCWLTKTMTGLLVSVASSS